MLQSCRKEKALKELSADGAISDSRGNGRSPVAGHRKDQEKRIFVIYFADMITGCI